ncbi:hypothetical protein [Pseudotabrizicola algicola]|uniref:Uncharacterized protein n=1 Tax=Pseudotabrizicola algicola TaxID=2709381 RepID=A0A6B3RLU1_9RHOB|nr:hypothetical protein [Pseudotabrizicola algicola]NEX46143.1 hypothetical protein [Pseudotabrizicola algicola]
MAKPAPKYGPTRGEYLIRLAISGVGLAMLGGSIALQGWPEGPGLVEVVGFAGLFFGVSAIGALRGLLR